MTPNDIKELREVQPFEPFEIHLVTGERFTVRHPENLLLGKTKCYYPMFDNGLVERMVHIALRAVVKLVPLNGASRNS